MLDYDFNNFEFDTNGDGIIDTYVEYCDTDGDGIIDTYVEHCDTDGDGYYETSVESRDTNGDGYYETHIESYDTNRSGMIDTIVVYHDSAGNGNADTIAKMHDYNEDGIIDSVNTHQDIDGDGRYEVLTKSYDSTGDGQIDTVDVYVDLEGNGKADIHNMYTYDPMSGDLIPSMAAGFEVGGTYYTELENFDPNNVDDPNLISGNPAESIEVWEYQGQTNRCALYSEKFVIEELTGQEIDIEEFTDIAKANGWFTEDGGTTFLNMDNMLDYYNIDNEMSFHNSINDIEECLNNGGKVIVSIDSDEIWHGKDNDIFAPESGANHAVQVIGIDRTDPNNPMVILNDSGSPYGRGEMVPLEVFEGAWEVGDCQMIECYKS